jgi:hypothetical protein
MAKYYKLFFCHYLVTKYEEFFEGTSIEADEKKKPRILDNILGLTLELIYEDDSRQEHITKLTIIGPSDYISNERL